MRSGLWRADWAAFKALVTKNKAEGKPLKVAASRGSAQDIHMRGAFFKQGIDPNGTCNSSTSKSGRPSRRLAA